MKNYKFWGFVNYFLTAVTAGFLWGWLSHKQAIGIIVLLAISNGTAFAEGLLRGKE